MFTFSFSLSTKMYLLNPPQGVEYFLEQSANYAMNRIFQHFYATKHVIVKCGKCFLTTGIAVPGGSALKFTVEYICVRTSV